MSCLPENGLNYIAVEARVLEHFGWSFVINDGQWNTLIEKVPCKTIHEVAK